ncbi:MAG: hypothetical protein V1690_02290 [Candidatus Moraniibacteriota bacterium]
MPNPKPAESKQIGSTDIKKTLKAKSAKIVALIVGAILIALLGFAGGMSAGFHKARFSCNWGENYERNFMGPSQREPMGFFRDFEGREMRNAHGLAGKIISITDNKLIIQDRDNKENTVSVTDKTKIKQRRDELEIGDLKQNDEIIVVGNPDDNGVVNADLIRVFNREE